jgi:predicted O-linked N-acetylglucosamine transferase (SPINDLY family)
VLRQRQKQSELAMADYEKAIELVPHYAEAHMNRGALLYANKHYDEALKSFDQAIELDPHYAHAYFNRATLLVELKRWEPALATIDRLLELAPNFRAVFGMRVFVKLALCDWRDFESDLRRLADGIDRDLALSAPLPLLTMIDRPTLHLRAAQIWAREEHGSVHPVPPSGIRPTHEKIRIGYFSADFREHVVARVAAQLFELHDRSKFEIIAFSFSPDADDDMRRRLQRAFDRFLDVSAMPDREVALLARSLDIDIAVDLGGYTTGCRTKIFALRAAPIQINFLGFPGTMGVPFMDYLIGDRTVVPESHQRHYTEKIIYLPNSFLPYDATTKISTQQFTREQFGLPSGGFVFCCFNSPYKILPDVFDTWMRILARVPNGVLWFTQSTAAAAGNLRQEAARRGIAPDRLIFTDRLPNSADHLARQTLGDLLLDTLPYNAHATAMDALWAGLPVLTRAGEGFAGRVAASLLRTLDLTELIAGTAEQYEDLAVALASNPGQLAAIRRKLLENRHTMPLFDTPVYTRNLESAYTEVWMRHWAQSPTDRIA